MILKTLRAVNFKSLQNETIDFKEGVTLIRGLNESGKSTIMEAVLYALYGYVLRPKTNPPLSKLIEFNSPRALIQLTFEIAGHRYQVTREIFRSKKRTSQSSIVEILPGGKRAPKGVQSVTEVTNTVKSLMGDISYNEIVSSCIVAQKELGKLVGLRKGERTGIINVFLNLEHFNQITDIVKDKRRDLLGKRESGGGQIDLAKGKLEMLRDEVEQYNLNLNEKNEKSKILAGLKKTLVDDAATHSSKDTLLETLEKYNTIWLQKKELDGNIESLKEQWKIQNFRLEKLNELVAKRIEIQSSAEQLEYVDESSPLISDLKEFIQEYRTLKNQSQVLLK